MRETENPFGDDEDDEAPPAASSSKSPSPAPKPSPPVVQITGKVESSKDKKKKLDKSKDKKGRKNKPFNLEAEKEQMKSTIADSSMAATGLLNALQTINREKERISENQLAIQRFEACKLLRRKVLRYVSPPAHASRSEVAEQRSRSTMSNPSSGLAACCMPMTSSSRP